MKTVELRVTIAANGKLSVDSSVDLPLGEYNAVLILDEQPIHPPQNSLETAQAILRKYIPAQRSLSAELIQDRREEGKNE
jgi:hypothetical protein